MLGYFKRVGEPSSKDAASKRPRTAATAADNASADPLTIVTWNANGLGVRLRKDWEALKEFLTNNNPDVCCIQEVWTHCTRYDDSIAMDQMAWVWKVSIRGGCSVLSSAD